MHTPTQEIWVWLDHAATPYCFLRVFGKKHVFMSLGVSGTSSRTMPMGKLLWVAGPGCTTYSKGDQNHGIHHRHTDNDEIRNVPGAGHGVGEIAQAMEVQTQQQFEEENDTWKSHQISSNDHVGIGVATDLSVETRMDTTSQSDSQSDGLVGCLKCSECGQCREWTKPSKRACAGQKCDTLWHSASGKSPWPMIWEPSSWCNWDVAKKTNET